MKHMDVMFYEAFEEEEGLLRSFLPPDILAGFTSRTIQSSPADAPPAGIISIRTQSQIPLSWKGSLRGVLSRSAGYDHLVRFQRETRENIPCGYLQDYCSRAVAEHAVLLMMALLRKFPRQQKQMMFFDRDGLTGQECRGRRALVVGVGNIGGEIADIARGLGMTVRGVDVVSRRKDLEYVSLNDGILWADVVFCALPLTEATRGMLSAECFHARSRPLFLINIARGEITPLGDMVHLLEAKKLAGLALDVYPREEKFAETLRATASGGSAPKGFSRLILFENVICTPHNAFNTHEALLEKCRQTVEALQRFLAQGHFFHEVEEKVKKSL